MSRESILTLSIAILAFWGRNGFADDSQSTGDAPTQRTAMARVSPEEREQLGLPAPAWVAEHGKASAALRQAIVQERAAENDPLADFKPGRPVGSRGAVYVDVYLLGYGTNHDADSIKALQASVLKRLTAAEFSCTQQYKTYPAITGYVNSTGLERLLDDAEVIAIGLDTQPQVTLTVETTPQPEGKEGREKPNGPAPKIAPQVYAALESSPDGFAFVIVNLVLPAATLAEYDNKSAAARHVQNEVLSRLVAFDFRVVSRVPAGGFTGFVNNAGLAKLADDADVAGVGLTLLGRVP